MNDRYLFKAKRIDSGEWLVGSLISMDDGEFRIATSCLIDNQTGLLTVCAYKVVPDSICQCTGLKDRYGNLIWENDVVKIPAFTPHYMSIKFIEGAFCLGNNKGEYVADIHYIHSAGRNETEVVDNIFDNPELLEAE